MTRNRSPKTFDVRSAIETIVVFASLLACGCSDERRDELGPTTGIVTFQGRPVTTGQVIFDNGQGIARVAPLGADGRYEVQSADGFGLPLGRYQVAIQPRDIEHPLGPIKEPPKPRNLDDIPPRYRDPKTSGLSVEVKPGPNEHNFSMAR